VGGADDGDPAVGVTSGVAGGLADGPRKGGTLADALALADGPVLALGSGPDEPGEGEARDPIAMQPLNRVAAASSTMRVFRTGEW
jgi:hypothetical protein